TSSGACATARSLPPIPGAPRGWNGRRRPRRPPRTSRAPRWSRGSRTTTSRSSRGRQSRRGRPPLADAALESVHAHVAHQFDDAEQQREASTLGMWVFLAQEVMFFGGLFTCYVVYRTLHATGFAHASHHLDVVLGTTNTAVLITSSLTMALAVWASQMGRR